MSGSLPGEYFDALYATATDRWGFASRWYEQRSVCAWCSTRRHWGPATSMLAVTQLRAQGHQVRDEDAALLPPLKAKHLNVPGRYAITASQPSDGLRPLRDAADAEDLVD